MKKTVKRMLALMLCAALLALGLSALAEETAEVSAAPVEAAYAEASEQELAPESVPGAGTVDDEAARVGGYLGDDVFYAPETQELMLSLMYVTVPVNILLDGKVIYTQRNSHPDAGLNVTVPVGIAPGEHTVGIETLDHVLLDQKPLTAKYAEKAFSKNGSMNMYVGGSVQLQVSNKTIKTCASSAKKVAAVTKAGYVTAKSAGKAKLTVTTTDNKKLTINVTVTNPQTPTQVTLNYTGTRTLNLGEKKPFPL